ncbi:MAG: response regulator [Nitrospirae bacterium]|nr:MAG: response regulator [Nitrospirota bacterium]
MATILIANADHRFSEVLRSVLTTYHHEVVVARTGEEAIKLFDAVNPALVLLDLALLGKPGLEVLAQIRARSPHLPVMILTGEVSLQIEDRAREMGVTDVLRKRLKMDVIMQAINHVFLQAGRQGKAAPAIASPGKPATILIVDDEPEICEMVGEFLGRRGYRTTIAYSGEEALAKVKQEPPDLVLLDIYMPGINGVEVLRQLVKDRFAGGVIMLTASQDEPLLKIALDLGAFDVLPKPVNLEQVELAVMVKLVLNEPDASPGPHR